MLDTVRFAPITKCIDSAQLTREFLAQQFERKFGCRSWQHSVQLTLFAQQCAGDFGAANASAADK
jgi:hypothetical protein